MKKRLSEVKGFENCPEYILYSDGRIYSEISKRFLKCCIDSKGYVYIDLRGKNALIKNPKVHRLMMLAFKPENQKEQINHIDGNKLNNNIENLEWVTQKENRIHAIENKLKDEVSYGIEQYDLNGNLLNTFETCTEALNFLKIKNGCPGNIGRAIRGKRATAYGYIWKNCESSTTIPNGEYTISD